MRKPAIWTGLAVALFALAACDAEVPSLEDAQQALEKAGETVEKAKGLVANLDADKIKEIGELAVEIEKNPEKAQELLKDHGMDKEQFQKVVDAIGQSPELKKLFEAAKDAARKAS